MATVKKGTLTRSPQWWVHLRKWKRVFWKSERKAAKAAMHSDWHAGYREGMQDAGKITETFGPTRR